MELKYTLEILAKDIQDIGKLVENLQNSPEGSTLELDLTLSKLRNVYDVLSDIRTDISLAGRIHQVSAELTEAQIPGPEPVAETPVHTPEPPAETPASDPEPVAETPVQTPEPPAETPASDPEPEPIQEVPKAVIGKDPSIIAERFAAESSINENMAGTRETNKDSKVIGKPIDHIGKNIGINDRFLIIRELFDGDSDGFGKLIQDLDSAGSLQTASERLKGQFINTPDHEGISILSNLIKRKYSHS